MRSETTLGAAGITMALAGDVMLGRGVNDALQDMEPEDPWADLLPLLRSADVRIVNLECALTRHSVPWLRSAKAFHFRANPEAVRVLRAASIGVVSLANNHTLDFEVQGLLDTLAHLDEAGIQHAGAGRDIAQARRPALMDVRGRRLGLVACTDNEPDFAAQENRPGTFYLPVSLDKRVLDVVAASIADARRSGAELVVFSNHWGPNMVERPPELFQRFAHAVIDLGADLFFGHSAHLVQGVEVHHGRLILYDTGDFLDDYAIDPLLRNDWSFLFRTVLSPGGPPNLELFPVRLGYATVHVARGNEREAICARMQRLCEELGTRVIGDGDKLLLEEGSTT